MKKCPACSYENYETAKFCSMCGCELSFIPKCPYCGSSVSLKAKFCHTCGMSLDPQDQPVEFEIETAFWLSHKGSAFGQQEYLKRYPNGYYKNEVDYEAIKMVNQTLNKSPEKKRKENRLQTVKSARKVIAILFYVMAFICFLLFLIFGREGLQLLGLPSGAGIYIVGRLIDPDVKSF